jgi:hypothetical protein
LETRDDNLIGRIDKIIVTNDKFIILDLAIAKKVLVFDHHGKFLNVIGKMGEGPEEYDSPNDIAYDSYNDELLIWCHNKKTIMKFKINGTFVRNIKIDWWVASIYVTGLNSYLLYLNNYTQKNGNVNDYNIQIIDDNGNIISRMLPYNKDKIVLSPPCLNDFCTFQEELLFSPHYSNTIFKIDMDSAKMRSKYYFDFGKHNIPRSLFNPAVTPGEFDKAIQSNSNYAFNINFMETTSHVVNQFVYKRKIYTCFHSKESGITKYSAHFINDINLYPEGIFHTQQGDLLIGYVETNGFIELQSLVKEMEKTSKEPDNIKDILIKNLTIPSSSIFSNKLKDNYSQAIKSSTITSLSDEEINFINSVDESDNPIIQIAVLKKF